VQKLAAEFVVAADACDRMQKTFCQDADALLFRKFAKQRTIKREIEEARRDTTR